MIATNLLNKKNLNEKKIPKHKKSRKLFERVFVFEAKKK